MQGPREEAGVSGKAMNVVYEYLRMLSPETLRRIYERADPETAWGKLLKHQLAVTTERRADGRWSEELGDGGDDEGAR
jgi:hypothetical protein